MINVRDLRDLHDDPIVSDDGWVECWNCAGDGIDGHDCGEDCCCCAEPEDNVTCSICDGEGGWIVGAPSTTRAGT